MGEGETDANWRSSDPTVVVVFRNGNTVAREPGDALVSVQAQGQSVNVPVHVGERGIGGTSGNNGNNGNNGKNGNGEDNAEAIVLSEDDVRLDALGETLTVLVKKVDSDGSEVEDYPVSWKSENPDVATVDSEGKLIARAVGTTLITADADCCAEETVKVTVRQVVTAVAITGGALTLQVGETATFDASAKDANGHEVPGASFEWSSSDRGVATVDQKGKITAQNHGDASIRATAEDAVGEVGVAVESSDGGTRPSGSVDFPNEPAGFQRWAEHDMTTLPDGDLSHQGYADVGYGDNYTVVGDPSAPNGRAVRIRYPKGQRGGRSPGRFFVWSQENPDGGNHRTSVELDEVYISLHVQLEGEDWEFPGSELKMFYTGGGRQGTHTWGHASFYTGGWYGNHRSQDGDESQFFHRHQQFRVSARPSSSEATRMIRNTRYADDEHRHALLHHVGPWRHLEYYRKAGDVDTPNGIIRLWVDGELLIEATDVLDQTTYDGDWTYGFHQFHWSPVFGGGFSKNCDEDGDHCVKRRDDFMRLGHLYISGVPR